MSLITALFLAAYVVTFLASMGLYKDDSDKSMHQYCAWITSGLIAVMYALFWNKYAANPFVYFVASGFSQMMVPVYVRSANEFMRDHPFFQCAHPFVAALSGTALYLVPQILIAVSLLRKISG